MAVAWPRSEMGAVLVADLGYKIAAAKVMRISNTLIKRVQTTIPHLWDGEDEDYRPLTHEEMQAGIEADRRQRGRPTGSGKESTTIRFDRDVLAAFSADGPGWQTRMNAALLDGLKLDTVT
jgi:uncharacterized protein (DUF4415 family)